MNETRSSQVDSRSLLRRLRDLLADSGGAQTRLDRLTEEVAHSMRTDVCSIYLLRDSRTLELCATEGLNPKAVHKTRLRLDEGVVGRVASECRPLNTGDVPSEKGFRYMPETGEEVFSSFLGVPLQRLGDTLGVIAVQSKVAKAFSKDDVFLLEVVAMVVSEMAELGAFVGEGEALAPPHTRPAEFACTIAHEGLAAGNVLLHEPRVVVANPVADDIAAEQARLSAALDTMRSDVDDMLSTLRQGLDDEQREIFEAYRMFANSRGWVLRMEANIDSGLTAAASVEKEQSEAMARMNRAQDAYLRDRLHDLDDLFNRLLRILTGQGRNPDTVFPPDAVLVARNIGPGELLEYARYLKGAVLDEGSIGSHAAIIARAYGIPLLINAKRITTEALNGDRILVDGYFGCASLRPADFEADHFSKRIAMIANVQRHHDRLRNKPARTKDGTTISLNINAGLIDNLPNLELSGADGVGLFRTELHFLSLNRVPRRSELAAHYDRVISAARGRRVAFRTLDIGSDKMLPYLKRQDEPNPAMGWRAIRIAIDRPGVLRMQLQAMIRGARGRKLTVMFPLIAEMQEFEFARSVLLEVISSERRRGHDTPSEIEVGAMLETPSLAFAPDSFFESVDFISIGGNDLKQFFFAADRENERVRRNYDVLSKSYLKFIKQISDRCRSANVSVGYCGEDAGYPLAAVCFAALGLTSLSMRSGAIGAVKSCLRSVDLGDVRDAITDQGSQGQPGTFDALMRIVPTSAYFPSGTKF